MHQSAQFTDPGGWRGRLYEVIFEADTPGGKAFDVLLILAIILSVLIVMLESVKDISRSFGAELRWTEWFFTLLFTLEYLLRLISVSRPAAYAKSFFGLVDVMAILPTYLSLFLPGGQYLLAIRILRLLRIFRVFKLAHYLDQAAVLSHALRASRHKILVFLLTVLTLVVIVGSLIYVIEGEANGFTSIPRSIYWAIVTLTTVGYGDITPRTNLGQFLASIVMITGYAIIAVPTGIVTVELTQATERFGRRSACPGCQATHHEKDAIHCKHCGARLPDPL